MTLQGHRTKLNKKTVSSRWQTTVIGMQSCVIVTLMKGVPTVPYNVFCCRPIM